MEERVSAMGPVVLKISADAELEAARSVAELRSFLEQLGSPETLNAVNASTASLFQSKPGANGLKEFLEAYKTEVLFAREWPAILRAYSHARQNECRELVELDCELAGVRVLETFRAASLRIGHWQLNQLGPLRGERIVQKYRAAVEEGRAAGWHTIVYGLTLAIYSFPLRQGLLNYATQVLQGYARSAARDFGLAQEQQQELVDGTLANVPQKLEELLAKEATARIT